MSARFSCRAIMPLFFDTALFHAYADTMLPLRVDCEQRLLLLLTRAAR